jgi:hypothetical protein
VAGMIDPGLALLGVVFMVLAIALVFLGEDEF